ncbi:unnamed protein product [Pieris macdunnoughi]|uniref:Gustatory receptor n=1 Tax=Pieris macdunnoughi TaxID=345717 RepID=A0A821TGG9_9NEOP|nr:unnamed protein product [Pieris macdunnoughi]
MYADVSVYSSVRILKLINCVTCFWSKRLLKKPRSIKFFDSTRLTYSVYIDILKVYEAFTCVFKMSIFLQVTDYFIRTLIYIQIYIEIDNIHINDPIIKDVVLSFEVFFFAWNIKNLLNIVSFVKECETMYQTILDIDNFCTTRLSQELPMEESKLYNNIKRLNQTQFKKMSVYGVFVMDAGLPVGLVQLLTTYVIVILQFALT